MMRSNAAAALALVLAAPALAQSGAPAPDMVITRADSQASSQGPAQYFTGKVRVQPLFGAQPSSATTGASVSFEPGARSAWHTHPAGQMLVVPSQAPPGLSIACG